MHFSSSVFQVLYICDSKVDRNIDNQEQLKLVQKDCQGKEHCLIEANRKYFGNSECPGTDDAEMALWLLYSCEAGGFDKTESYRGYGPQCPKKTTSMRRTKETGTGKKVDVRPNV